MEVSNAFLGKGEQPSPQALFQALGPTAGLWNELVEWMSGTLGVSLQEWKGIYVNRYGWSLRLKLKKRTIVYLAPCLGCFRVAFSLSDNAVAAVRKARLPKAVLQALAEATRYPEGTGLRLVVNKAQDLAAIRTVARIKLAN